MASCIAIKFIASFYEQALMVPKASGLQGVGMGQKVPGPLNRCL